MAVYVDSYFATFGRMRLSHMMADTSDELLAMADRIGVARKWLQRAGDWCEHFDVCKAKRALAVAAGAHEVTSRTLVRAARARAEHRRQMANEFSQTAAASGPASPVPPAAAAAHIAAGVRDGVGADVAGSMSEPTIKRPPAHWERVAGHPAHAREGIETWNYSGFVVTSQLDGMEAPDSSHDIIPTWLLAISRRGRRATDEEVARVLRAFSMEAALEDNHHPGVSRAFFLPVDPARRVDCECKVGEALVKEPDGYEWSNDVSECRGCEYARLYGKPCPIHAKAENMP